MDGPPGPAGPAGPKGDIVRLSPSLFYFYEMYFKLSFMDFCHGNHLMQFSFILRGKEEYQANRDPEALMDYQ